MPEPVKKPVRLGRMTLVITATLLFAWIGGSTALSLSNSFLWEHARVVSTPHEDLAYVKTRAEAMEALKGIRVFHEQLRKSALKYFSRFQKSPERAIHLWRRWEENWLDDYHEFARRYSFSSPDNRARGPYDEVLAHAQGEVIRLHERFSEHFEALFGLTLRDESDYREMYDMYKDEIQGIPVP